MDLHQSGLGPKTDIQQIRENCRDHAVKYVSNSDVSWSLQESGKLRVIACELSLLLPAFLFSKCRVPVVLEFILIQTSIKKTTLFSFNA